MRIQIGDTVESWYRHGSHGVVEGYGYNGWDYKVRWEDGKLEESLSLTLVKKPTENVVSLCDDIIDSSDITDVVSLQERVKELAFLVKQLYQEAR